jgi:hypothetical protein
VACLIAAINQANVHPGMKHEIRLAAGTYRLTTVDNGTDGPNGLPWIARTVTITGVGAEAIMLQRESGSPDFRLLHVAPTGVRTVAGPTLRGGDAPGGGVSSITGGMSYWWFGTSSIIPNCSSASTPDSAADS